MKAKLLCIDDNEMIRSFLENYFSGHFTVTSAESAEKAWEWLDAGNFPSIILLDLKMPETDGFQLLTQLKLSALFNDIPVIILSSIENSAEKIKCLEAGAADYVLKPFNPRELEMRVLYHMRRQSS